jgi:tripartite-type tricarboxylate transporter receptor subunit TctC
LPQEIPAFGHGRRRPTVRAGHRRAQAYPSRPVRLIATFPAGGVVDLYARLIGQSLSEVIE